MSQQIRINRCDRKARVREIRLLCFGSGSRHSLRPATNAAAVDVHQSFSLILSQQQGILSQQVLGKKSLQLCTRTQKNSILFCTKSHISSFSDKKKSGIIFGNLSTFHAVTTYSLFDWPIVSMCRSYDRRWQGLCDLLLAKHNCALSRAPATLEK